MERANSIISFLSLGVIYGPGAVPRHKLCFIAIHNERNTINCDTSLSIEKLRLHARRSFLCSLFFHLNARSRKVAAGVRARLLFGAPLIKKLWQKFWRSAKRQLPRAGIHLQRFCLRWKIYYLLVNPDLLSLTRRQVAGPLYARRERPQQEIQEGKYLALFCLLRLAGMELKKSVFALATFIKVPLSFNIRTHPQKLLGGGNGSAQSNQSGR